MTSHRVIFGDSRTVLRLIDSESVALTVTSPPYYVHREYEEYLKTEDEYWALMKDVFTQAARVTEPFGKVAINFADRYANYKELGYPCEVLYAHKFDKIMQDANLVLWTRVIWDKVGVYTEGARHLHHPQNKTGHMRAAPNWEYILVWMKNSDGKKPVKDTDMTDAERVKWTDSIWSFSSVPKNETIGGFKLARFPEELPYRLMKMYTSPGDLVLDPFGGMCTVAKVAAHNNRHSISIERNIVLEESIKSNLGIHNGFEQGELFDPPDIRFEYEGNGVIRGTVSDQTGKTLSGIQIRLSREGWDDGVFYTGYDGEYIFTDLPPATYSLSAADFDEGSLTLNLGSLTLDLGPGEEPVIDLTLTI